MPGTTHVGSRLLLVSCTSGEGNFFTLKFESQQSFRLEAFPPRQVKAHTFVQKGYFCFFHYFLFASLINNWAQTFAGWLFLLHLVGIHQGRITGLWLIPKIYTLPLKAVDTNGNCQNPVFSLCVSQHVHDKKTCENLSSIGRRSCEITMKEKTPLSHKVVYFQMLDFETSSSKLEVSKSNSWKITCFSKTIPLQREPFLTRFYTINLSLLIVTN